MIKLTIKRYGCLFKAFIFGKQTGKLYCTHATNVHFVLLKNKNKMHASLI